MDGQIEGHTTENMLSSLEILVQVSLADHMPSTVAEFLYIFFSKDE